MNKNNKKSIEHFSYSMLLKHIKHYLWDSEEWYVACLILFGSLIAAGASVCCISFLSSGINIFWAAITVKDYLLYINSIQSIGLALTGLVTCMIIQEACINSLQLNWQMWLKEQLLKQYKKNHSAISRESPLDHIPQRITEDVERMVSNTLNLGVDLIQRIGTLIVFGSTLWSLGGALTLTVLGLSVTISGYLFWIGLGVSVISTLITKFLGQNLKPLDNELETYHADFREDLSTVVRESETVALDRAENYFFNYRLKGTLDKIKNTFRERIKVQFFLSAFKNYYSQIAWLIPYFFAAPLYFSGIIPMDHLMQIGFAYGQTIGALNWFIDSVEVIAQLQASAGRLFELEKLLISKDTLNEHQGIRSQAIQSTNLKIVLQQLKLPSGKIIMENLDLSFSPGQHALIQGDSGKGKSTLFKVIGGNWRYGEGELLIPTNDSVMVLPTKPLLPPNRTLKELLIYPSTIIQTFGDNMTDDEIDKVCKDYLKKIGLAKHCKELNTSQSWAGILSSGEQQRISFGRALIHKPKWIFLDESIASLDKKSSIGLYQLLMDELPNATLISIAHHPSDELAEMHSQRVNFDKIDTLFRANDDDGNDLVYSRSNL